MGLTVDGVAQKPIRWGVWVDQVVGENERVIEWPLAFEVLATHRPGRILDAGCACNLAMAQEPRAELTHLTLTLDDERQYPQPHRVYVEADLRDLSRYPRRHFDRIVCVSTLEHVGLDNRNYGGTDEHDPASVVHAVHELWRICAGTLLITVPWHDTPFQYLDHWRCFTPQTIGELVPKTGGVGKLTRAFYARAADGWRGPYDQPQTGLPAPKPVQQILAMRLWR